MILFYTLYSALIAIFLSFLQCCKFFYGQLMRAVIVVFSTICNNLYMDIMIFISLLKGFLFNLQITPPISKYKSEDSLVFKMPKYLT